MTAKSGSVCMQGAVSFKKTVNEGQFIHGGVHAERYTSAVRHVQCTSTPTTA